MCHSSAAGFENIPELNSLIFPRFDRSALFRHFDQKSVEVFLKIILSCVLATERVKRSLIRIKDKIISVHILNDQYNI